MRIVFEHLDGGYDFVAEEDLAGRTSLEVRQVASPGGGSKPAHKVQAPHITQTVATFPDDYDGHPQALTHYVQTLLDSHAVRVATVYGPLPLASKLAILLEAEYGGLEPGEADV